MRKKTICISVAILTNFLILAVVYTQTPTAHKSVSPISPNRISAKPQTSAPPCHGSACPRTFPNTWDGVHQFVVGDGNMGHPDRVTRKVQDIADLLRPDAAKLDFVWGGDKYAACWAGDQAFCPNQILPANPQHPIVGHYLPFFGIQMLAGYARCLDNTDCDAAIGKSGEYECKRLPDVAPDFKAWITERINVYTDAANHREKVCMKVSGPDRTPELTGQQAQAVEFSYWRRTKPGWLLYWQKVDTKDGVPWFGGGPPLDISNPAVTKEILGRIKRWARLGPRKYYGAISLDTVELANGGGARYRCLQKGGAGGAGGCTTETSWQPVGHLNGKNGYGCPELLPGGITVTGYCDPSWTRLVQKWVEQVRFMAHAVGLNLVVNVAYGGTDVNPFVYIPARDSRLLKLFDTVDGVLDESGFTSGYGRKQVPPGDGNGCAPMWTYNGEYICPHPQNGPVIQDRWSNFYGYLRAVQYRGKSYFSKNAAPGPPVDTSDPNPDIDPHLDASAIQWTLASFLISRGVSPSHARQSIFIEQNNYDIGYVRFGASLYNALNPAIGHPCPEPGLVPHSPQPNVFTRQFSGGFVVVNANGPGGAAATINLPLPNKDVTWPASAPTSLAAESGAVILVNTGRLCK